jgi:hypothetical protein
VERVAERAELGLPRAGAGRARQVHADRAVALAGEAVALGREVDVTRGLGGDRRAVVGRKHATQEAHRGSV